jgi:hypothetical protein
MYLLGSAFLALASGTLVVTPHGYRLKQCVREVPQGAIVAERSGQLSVTLIDGSEQLYDVPPECHEDVNNLRNQREQAQARLTTGVKNVGIADGWLDYGGFYSEMGKDSYKAFNATYTVPDTPKSTGGQTLYYFIGMQDNSSPAVNIVQPVLTYGQAVDGGASDWNVASWCCCPSNITTHSPSAGPLKPGDVLQTSVFRDDPSTWTIDAITPSQQHATLRTKVGSYVYNWADVTLEVYGVQSCDQLASGTATFSDMILVGKDGPAPPVWKFTAPTACNGVIAGDAKTVTVKHN